MLALGMHSSNISYLFYSRFGDVLMYPRKFCPMPAEHGGRMPLLNVGFLVLSPGLFITFSFKTQALSDDSVSSVF